jgi:jumonji domain-containing protein 7
MNREMAQDAEDGDDSRGSQPARVTHTVERVTEISAVELEAAYIRRNRPLVWAGGAAGWPAARWTPATLVARAGDVTFQVSVSKDGRFRYDALRGHEFPRLPMKLRDVWPAIEEQGADGPRFYVMQQPLALRAPALLEDLDLSRLPARVTRLHAHLWLGGPDTVTPLHYDAVNNVYVQVFGRKRMLLFGPDDLNGLYPFPIDSSFPHVSHVDPERVDTARFPAFAACQPYEVELGPGDLFFLPAFWWHHVRSTTTALSVNFWFAPALQECFHATGLRVFEAMYARNRFQGAGQPVPSRASQFVEGARLALEHGQPRFAALFAMAAEERCAELPP